MTKPFQAFCQKYNINLNEQQQLAVQAAEGASLLLAVPGSGKTTVLIARIGYLIFAGLAAPQSILAITYTKAAAEDMCQRFAEIFGWQAAAQVDFRTINSLASDIIKRYCAGSKRQPGQLLERKQQQRLLRKIYQNITGEYSGESFTRQMTTEIAYIKNMQLVDADIMAEKWKTPRLADVYKRYQADNKQNHRLDFDDQLVYALDILQRDQGLLAELRRRYRYICVDEAQDTSRIQHNIIYLLAAGSNNLFMVGDEDQSIYGYRAAYPQALLRFAEVYREPGVLLLEQNYRSVRQIVAAAAKFIAQNPGRYEKSMVAVRSAGEPVQRIEVNDRLAQYQYLLEVARRQEPGTAILYRENNSAVPLVDLLLREGIPFHLQKSEQSLLEHTIAQDIRAFIKLALDPCNQEAFAQIYSKCGLYISKSTMEAACKKSRQFKITIFAALQIQMQYVKEFQREQAQDFQRLIRPIANLSPIEAIAHICENGYADYLEQQQFGYGNLELLEILAQSEKNLPDFLARLDYLEQVYKQKPEAGGGVVLSTIHSSKGLEFATVYLMDVYDGVLPSVEAEDKKMASTYQEERRLFYVAMTRAKNRLFLIDIKTESTSFIAEIMRNEIAQAKRDMTRQLPKS